MLNKIIKFSLNNRMVVLVASILLMLAGTYTATNMEVDVFPDLNAPTVVVMTEATGMANLSINYENDRCHNLVKFTGITCSSSSSISAFHV